MITDKKNYTERKFPVERRLITDPFEAARRKNIVHGVFELDVTKFKQESKEQRISFFSRALFAIARATVNHPIVNSYKKGNTLVQFNEVDICIVVERVTGKERLPLPYIIRNAHLKTAAEIHEEVELAKKGNVEEIFMHAHMRLYLSLPKFIRKLYWRYLLSNPHALKARVGTIAVTALHGIGNGMVHFDPLAPYTLTLALGKISKNADGRYLMNTTISGDHDIVDGMDGVIFGKEFCRS